jgi:hypothetical protein
MHFTGKKYSLCFRQPLPSILGFEQTGIGIILHELSLTSHLFSIYHPQRWDKPKFAYEQSFRKRTKKAKLKKAKVDPTEIKYLPLTHSHDDYAGFAAELREKTGCRIIVHKNSVNTLRNGRITGLGRFLMPHKAFRLFIKRQYLLALFMAFAVS